MSRHSPHYREPVENTCPQIDYVRYMIRETMKEIGDVRKLETNSIAAKYFNDVLDKLEVLRNSNAELRKWGNDEAHKVDELEQQNENLRERITQLEEAMQKAD